MISVLVRVSTWIWPRADSAERVSSGCRSWAPCIAEREGLDPEVAGQRPRLGQLAALGFFFGQHVERRDPDDRALGHVAELVGAQDRLERLVPRDVAHEDVDRALNRRIEYHVEAAVLDKRAQRCAQVRAVEVERYRRTDVAPLAALRERL